MRIFDKPLKLTLVSTVAIFLVAIGLCKLCELAGLPEQNQVEIVRQLAGWNLRFVALVAFVLIPTPAYEEAIFRLLLFRLPAKYCGGRVAAAVFAVLSSAVFSFCHYIDFGAIAAGKGMTLLPISNAFLALFFVGLAWCWLYRRTGRIWCSMLSHSLFNLTNLVLALVL